MNLQNKKLENTLFTFIGLALFVFFLWTRIDFSERVYFVGDATVIIELIRIILETGIWDPNWERLRNYVDPASINPELLELHPIKPVGSGYIYNLAGYIIHSALICKFVYTLGIDLPIQTILHLSNVVYQFLTLILLYGISVKISGGKEGKTIGFLACGFFIFLPLAVMEAHYVRPESWLCLLTTGIIFCTCYFHEKPLSTSIGIGILLGLAVATKISQLALGIIPAILLLYFLFDKTFLEKKYLDCADRARFSIGYGAIILFSAFLALLIETPFIIINIKAHLASTAQILEFHKHPAAPYFIENYSYAKHLLLSLHYFSSTLGLPWLLLLFFSIPLSIKFLKAPFSFIIATPIVIFILYFSVSRGFFERNFSSLEGVFALASAFTIFYICSMLSKNKVGNFALPITACVLSLIIILPAARLNHTFISKYIHKTGNEERIIFQRELKKDFGSFWIRNINITRNYLEKLPSPSKSLIKAPRIYKIQDLNEPWTQRYIQLLQDNDFIMMAEFRSDFFGMPPNNLTIYHEPHRHYYFVKADEWPDSINDDYFKTYLKGEVSAKRIK